MANIPGVPFKLTPQDMGSVDLAGSLAKGIELGFLPREKQANLQSTLLKNIYQEIVNKYTPEDYRTTFALRGAQANLANTNARFTPLETYIKADNALRANSRFGKSYEFFRALNAMDPVRKAEWISQNQAEYSQMMSDLASGDNGQNGKSSGNALAESIMLHELQKQGGGFINQPQTSSSSSPSPQVNAVQQPLVQGISTSPSLAVNQPQTSGSQSASTLSNAVMNQAIPLEYQPKSNDPDVAAAQERIKQQKFVSNPSRDQQLKDDGLLFATRKANTAAMNARVDGAKVLDSWIKENSTPEIVQRLRNVAEHASGQTGQMNIWYQSKLPESLQADWFKDYKWYNDSFIPNTKNTIKQMEKLNGDRNQRSELQSMINMLDSPDLGPKGAITSFNRAIGSLQDMSNGIFSSAELPTAKGLFKRMYGIADKYDEFIPTGDKEKSSNKEADTVKVIVDGKEDTILRQHLQQFKKDMDANNIPYKVVG